MRNAAGTADDRQRHAMAASAMRHRAAPLAPRGPAGAGRGRPGAPAGPAPAGQAVLARAAACRPSSAMETSRILNFCTFPVTVIGKSLVNRT